MKTCTLSFPVSLGERVFHQRLRRTGTVIALSMTEGATNPKAQIEYLNKAGEIKSTWAYCDILCEPEQHAATPPARSPLSSEGEAA